MFKAIARKLFGGNRDSKAVAKSRLHFVLVQDRTGLSNDQMAKFRGELVEVIQRYFVIDEQGFDINYERRDESTTLVINSPVVVKRQEGVGGRVGSSNVSQSNSAQSNSASQNNQSSNKNRRRRARNKPASANA
ncbi:MAG: cell division topological specificity factor MinE [Bdellovibrionales bacterium]|nr:cell division topological specificity factor MinE [Bdellovibrionales bacterium]